MKNYEIKVSESIHYDFHDKHIHQFSKLKPSYPLISSTICGGFWLVVGEPPSLRFLPFAALHANISLRILSLRGGFPTTSIRAFVHTLLSSVLPSFCPFLPSILSSFLTSFRPSVIRFPRPTYSRVKWVKIATVVTAQWRAKISPKNCGAWKSR